MVWWWPVFLLHWVSDLFQLTFWWLIEKVYLISLLQRALPLFFSSLQLLVVHKVVSLGLTLLCLCLVTLLSLVTIATGWIAHRPILGMTLQAEVAVPILLSRRHAQALNQSKNTEEFILTQTLEKSVLALLVKELGM